MASCFGARPSSCSSSVPPSPPSSPSLSPKPSAQSPYRPKFRPTSRRKHSCKNSHQPCQHHRHSFTPPDGVPLSPEDFSTLKRRLVIIRRQPSFSPVTLSVGYKSRTGWRPLRATRHNQDALAIVLPLPHTSLDHSLFMVCDGHGFRGHQASSHVAQSIVAHFQSALASDKESEDVVPLALSKAFTRAASDLHSAILDTYITGTTATILIVNRLTLICANVGDSRIVLGSLHEDGRLHAIPLTRDHHPTDVNERIRVEAAGGRVDTWTPSGPDTGPPRVWLREKRLPGLSLTRVFGDDILSGIVSCEPELTMHQLTENDLFAVVASDGLWGVMSNSDVVNFIYDRQNDTAQNVAEAIIAHAAKLWYSQEEDNIDDITVIVVRFNYK